MTSHIHIRTNLRPGDLGHLIYLHGILYHELCGFDPTFEAYVATTFADLTAPASHPRNKLWIAEQEEKIAGGIGIVERANNEAQLRWLLIRPEFRGKGLGARLIDAALNHCREQGFARVYLDTVRQLEKAGGLYRSRGFTKMASVSEQRWGQQVQVERYELRL